MSGELLYSMVMLRCFWGKRRLRKSDKIRNCAFALGGVVFAGVQWREAGAAND